MPEQELNQEQEIKQYSDTRMVCMVLDSLSTYLDMQPRYEFTPEELKENGETDPKFVVLGDQNLRDIIATLRILRGSLEVIHKLADAEQRLADLTGPHATQH